MDDVAPHWTHERLAENLRTASHACDLNAAALEWTLRDTGDVRNIKDARAQSEIRCQLCNHVIFRYAVIANVVNGVLLIIGLDCLQKLIAFLESGRIEAPLRNGSGNRERFSTLIAKLQRELAAENAELQKLLSNKTVVGWFDAELEQGRLPEDVARLVRLTSLDCLPTPVDADTLVEYYKANRGLPIEVLVPAGRLHPLARFRRSLPPLITIAAVPRVLALAERAERLAAARRTREESAAKRAGIATGLANFRHRSALRSPIPDAALDRVGRIIERDRVVGARLRLPAALATLEQLIEQLRREIPGADWYLQTDVERLRTQITITADQPSSYTHVDLLRRVMEWNRVVHHQLESPTVHVYVDPKPAIPVVFSVAPDGSWQHERWFIREEQRPGWAGVYTARLVSGRDLFALAVGAAPQPRSATFSLNEPLDQSPFSNRYRGRGGRDGNRWMIPVPTPVWRAGTYQCLVLSEHEDHIFVYPTSRVRQRRQRPTSV